MAEDIVMNGRERILVMAHAHPDFSLGGGEIAAYNLFKAYRQHPDVADVRIQFLATRDAHGLYAKFGYRPLDDPDRWMARLP